ncbi:hypothetical protein OS493_024657 [Desmophyllum pertusum]|uniref:CCHC-type domain-containing protein n=1 Tax=Desmophyllum pertusum TaxID=174260 RepID=A0A9X0D350_9CNID|nr:hypothetical protein OS493_024657 [Desmophyllum pertusum]
MKQRATESIERFAFRFKNNLHRLAKLGEPVDRNSPQFIMSQFTSKTKTDIQKHLVLKAEEYKDLSEIIEAAKRIERSFSPGRSHSPPNEPLLEPPHVLTTDPSSSSPRYRRRGLHCYRCNSPDHVQSNCPEKTPKNNSFGNFHRGKEVCRLWNNHQQSPCTLQDQSCRSMAANTSAILVLSRDAKKLIMQSHPRPVVNSCDAQSPQATHPGPSSLAAMPTSSGNSQSAIPPLHS